jgi:hypothetical protein
MVMGMLVGATGTACVLKRRHRRAVLEKYKTSDEDLAAHFRTLNLGKYQFFRTFGRPSPKFIFLTWITLVFHRPNNSPKAGCQGPTLREEGPKSP